MHTRGYAFDQILTEWVRSKQTSRISAVLRGVLRKQRVEETVN